jgi:hypothetical protein
MGTPAAPLYSTISYGYHENTKILPKFKDNLLYYKRYIDDVFGIWIPSPQNTWDQFKNTLNSFGKLTWNIEEPSNSTTFLDLNITIQDNKLHYSISKSNELISIHTSSISPPIQLPKRTNHW